MSTIDLILLIAALVCFLIAAFRMGGRLGEASPDFTALGLALWVLTILIPE